MNILEPIEFNIGKRVASTHVGKIARLPKRLREELNRRLDEGEDGGKLLRWLNGLEDVKVILADVPGVWDGRVNKQNLSHWRQGGYREWKRQLERRDIALMLLERGVELGEEADGVDLSNHL